MMLNSILFGKKIYDDERLFLNNRAPIRRVPEHLDSIVQRKISGNHIYLEAGKGHPVIFSHGLYGGIFNIDTVCKEITKNYRFIMPYLPMYDLPLLDCTVKKLGSYLDSFINDLGLKDVVIIGSSMGGGAACYYAAKEKNNLKGLVLCGSSGLSNIPLTKGYFKRKNFDFVQEATRDIFFDRSIPPIEMVTDVFNALQSTEVVLRSIRFTKAATNSKMDKELPLIKVPACLIWGRQDPITPVEVAPKFQQLIPKSQLNIIDDCGHVPAQEKPGEFMYYFNEFMKKINQ